MSSFDLLKCNSNINNTDKLKKKLILRHFNTTYLLDHFIANLFFSYFVLYIIEFIESKRKTTLKQPPAYSYNMIYAPILAIKLQDQSKKETQMRVSATLTSFWQCMIKDKFCDNSIFITNQVVEATAICVFFFPR